MTIINWEKVYTTPGVGDSPAIVRFLGFDPFPKADTLAGRLLAKRREMGWSMERAAREVGATAWAWTYWERGETILHHKHREAVAKLLGVPADEIRRQMTEQWNAMHQK